MLTHLSLFSGIGGLDLAAEMAGFTTVGQCEWADFPTKVLEKHWPDVPRWRDIRTLTKESFYERTGLRTVDIISGGFPCQPFSVAGKQAGKEDDRYLWPEMLRVIRELKPRWVVAENVPGIIRLAAWDVAASLEREGFDTVVFDFEAAAVGAPHRRERIAFVANANSNGGQSRRANQRDSFVADTKGIRRRDGHDGQDEGKADRKINTLADESVVRGTWPAAYTTSTMCETGEKPRRPASQIRIANHSWWAVEPNVGRVANGIPDRVDRLKCLGNAVVPQQFYPFFAAIAEIEGGKMENIPDAPWISDPEPYITEYYGKEVYTDEEEDDGE